MSKFPRINSYSIDTNEEGLKITFIGHDKRTRIITAAVFLDFIFAALSVYFFVIEDYVVAYICLLGCVVFSVWAKYSLYLLKKRKEAFRFELNSTGICLCDVDGEFRLTWSDINSFGLVNNVLYETREHSNNYQSCMYFSAKEYDECFLRKKMLRSLGSRYGMIENTKSDDEIIIFPFCIDHVEREYEALCEYIYRYCDKEKERNFIKIAKLY